MNYCSLWNELAAIFAENQFDFILAGNIAADLSFAEENKLQLSEQCCYTYISPSEACSTHSLTM